VSNGRPIPLSVPDDARPVDVVAISARSARLLASPVLGVIGIARAKTCSRVVRNQRPGPRCKGESTVADQARRRSLTVADFQSESVVAHFSVSDQTVDLLRWLRDMSAVHDFIWCRFVDLNKGRINGTECLTPHPHIVI